MDDSVFVFNHTGPLFALRRSSGPRRRPSCVGTLLRVGRPPPLPASSKGEVTNETFPVSRSQSQARRWLRSVRPASPSPFASVGRSTCHHLRERRTPAETVARIRPRRQGARLFRPRPLRPSIRTAEAIVKRRFGAFGDPAHLVRSGRLLQAQPGPPSS